MRSYGDTGFSGLCEGCHVLHWPNPSFHGLWRLLPGHLTIRVDPSWPFV